MFGLFGPKSRDLIKTISNDDFDNDNLNLEQQNILQLKDKNLGTKIILCGELGYELYVELKMLKKYMN